MKFGTMIYYGHDFCALKSDGEVYRIVGTTEDLPEGIGSESAVEFELSGNRAINLKPVFFGPDIKAVLRGVKKIEQFESNSFGPYIDDCEGAIRHLYIGTLNLPFNSDKSYIEQTLKEIGAMSYAHKSAHHKTKQVKFTINNKSYEFENDLIHIALSYPITRLKNQIEVDKAEAELSQYYNEIDKKYREIEAKNNKIINIQQLIYSGGYLSRLYYSNKFKDKSYDYLKMKMA
jgi:hypothetical protein